MNKHANAQWNMTSISKFPQTFLVAALLFAVLPGVTMAQQFTSDNYLSMPHGTQTVVLTTGTEMTTVLPSFALFRNWEFFLAAVLYHQNAEEAVAAHYSTSFWGKYMAYENEARNGGWAVTAGTGSSPGYYRQQVGLDRGLKTWWITPMATLPLFGGALLWDLNPGAVVNTDYEGSGEVKYGFQYATRLALYGVIPKSALVGEVYGTAGDAFVEGQYRVGIRWEPSESVGAVALTWSQGLDGSVSQGLEIGVVIYSPRFLCFGGCDPRD